jgi:glycosyltransferase involved in cell wall biosynthesis
MNPVPSLRLLHVTPFYGDAWAYGGIPRAVAALARAQSRRGHRVTVATTDACSATARLPVAAGDPVRGPRQATHEPQGPEVRVFGNLSNRLVHRLQFPVPVGLWGFLHDNVGGFDVVHLHAMHNLPTSLAAHACLRARVPYLLQTHGTAPLIERRRLAKWAFDHTMGRGVFDNAARFIAVSEAEQRQLVELGAPAERIRIIPSALDLGELDLIPHGQLRARLGMRDEPLVVYLGQLIPRKRVDVLIHAFAALARPEARLVIVGPDMGSGAELRELARRHRLRDTVIFLDTLAGHARLAALADADVVAYPSEDEVLGLVPLEALLCGTPVVVGDDSGCGETITRVTGGRVVPVGDVAALAQALGEILDAQVRWRAVACQAQPAVRSGFGSASVAARIDDVYFEVGL